jgi:hypothetical protein
MSNETRERDIYLAKAMGWRYVPPGPETAEMYGDGVHCLRDPEGRLRATLFSSSVEDLWNHVTPQFHEWESAKVKLLRWMAADDARFEAFYNEIDAVYDETDRENQFSVVSWSRFLVTLKPAQVAEAAEKALLALCAEQEAGNG